ncbi:MAG TPA: hypothetical protein PKC21_07770 [Oligoflexia bacterium]|nr:hypothetical protein [Oligoflexia bacterium]HMR25235.1 hypothetical protein [Oligoflexia bacterium]
MQKKSKPFETELLNMFAQHSPMPDKNMHVESTEYFDRYIGPGDAAFYYALHLKKACSRIDFMHLVKDEIDLAQKRQRKAFELRLFPIPELDFSPELLTDLNFKPPRILDFFYSKADASIAYSQHINNKKVESEQDFKLLLSLLEQIFGPPSETLSEYLNNGLKHELADSKNLVSVYISYLNKQPAAVGWVKLYNKIGFLFGGGTLEKFRQKGLYKANLMARMQFAHQHGAAFVVSESSPKSAIALNKLNFNHLGKSHSWVYRFDS